MSRTHVFAAAGCAVAVFGIMMFWWMHREYVLHGVVVHADLMKEECIATEWKMTAKSTLYMDAFVGRSQKTGMRGLFSKNNHKKGDALIKLPSSCMLRPGDIFPANSWQQKMLDVRIKGYKKTTSIDTLHQLVTGILGCQLGQVNSQKVKLAREYYSTHVPYYPTNAYQYWEKHHRKFFNSMPIYAALNTPPEGIKSWRAFHKMYPKISSVFATYPVEQVRKVYSAVAARVFGTAAVLAPLIDYANHDQTPNTEELYDASTNVFNLVALKDIEAGDELTLSYGNRSNYFLLQKYGFEVGSDNKRAIAVSNSGCFVHFEPIDTYPTTGGINPTEWSCIQKTLVPSKILIWAQEIRTKLFDNLKNAKLDVLSGHADALSKTLLRVHSEQMTIFQGQKQRRSYWKTIISENSKIELDAKENEAWKKKALSAFST